jgi:hypothetical protein
VFSFLVVVRLRANLSGAVVNIPGSLGEFFLGHRAECRRFVAAEFPLPGRSIGEGDEVAGSNSLVYIKVLIKHYSANCSSIARGEAG